MIAKVTHFTLFVSNQDVSLDFFTNKLDLEVHTDTMYGDMRWLTICPVGQKDFEIVLMAPTNEEQKAAVGKQGAGEMLLALSTTDCAKDYERFKERGVKFTQEPTNQPWGMQALFVDPDGNMYNLFEPK